MRNLADRVVTVNAIDFNNMTGVVSEPRIIGVQRREATDSRVKLRGNK